MKRVCARRHPSRQESSIRRQALLGAGIYYVSACAYVCLFCVFVCILYIYMHICMYVYTHTYIHTYTYTYIHINNLAEDTRRLKQERVCAREFVRLFVSIYQQEETFGEVICSCACMYLKYTSMRLYMLMHQLCTPAYGRHPFIEMSLILFIFVCN